MTGMQRQIKESCTISATKAQFGATSCKGTLELAVEANC